MDYNLLLCYLRYHQLLKVLFHLTHIYQHQNLEADYYQFAVPHYNLYKYKDIHYFHLDKLVSTHYKKA